MLETILGEEKVKILNQVIQIDYKNLHGRLMHDLHCKNADEMYSSVLADRARMLKEVEGGIEIMCKEMEALYNQGIVNGQKIGEMRGKKHVLTNTLSGYILLNVKINTLSGYKSIYGNMFRKGT